ncbi:MAG TPA: GIY-YIG nuclease family protein [Flavobacteriales bacterium]
MSSSSNTCFLYILQSQVKDWIYIGVTNSIEDRLKRHNDGRSKATKPYRPFTLIFSKEFPSKAQAMKEEKRLKAFKNKQTLLQYIQLHR